MTNKYSKILIDCNNYYHRHYHRIAKNKPPNLYQEVGKSTFNGIKSIERNYGGKFCKIYCLFDNHNSKHNLRGDLSEDYKKNREAMPSKFYETLEQVKTMLLSYKDNYNIVYVDYLEADDIVLPLVETFDTSSSVLMVSEDLDWARLIDYEGRDIKWLTSKGVIGKEEYKNSYGFYPSLQSVVLYKTLRGDKSDGISPGLPNLREEVVLKICKEFYDIYDLIQNANKKEYISDHYKTMIKINSAELVRNFKLVSFIALPDFKDSIKNHIYSCSFKEQSLKLFYKSFDIPIESDNRIAIKTNKTLFHLDTLPRK